MKAATESYNFWFNRITISIHAAREGGDVVAILFAGGIIISIHAAREGGDNTRHRNFCYTVISIHAAREGGDFRKKYMFQK